MTGLSHKTPLEWSAFFEFPRRTRSTTNLRGDWRRKYALTWADREALHLAWYAAGRPKPPAWPAIVTFTRIAPRPLDVGDNLPSAFKAMRDELALCFGLADDAGDEVRWRYRQTTPREAGKATGYYGVRVEIRCEGRVVL